MNSTLDIKLKDNLTKSRPTILHTLKIEKATIIDIETVNFVGGILEVGAIVIDAKLEIISEIEVRTNVKVPQGHICGDIPCGKFSEGEATKILSNSIEGMIIGWNLEFERRILVRYGYAISGFDLMKWIKQIYTINDYKLDTVCKFFSVEKVEHRALSDCLAVLDILRKL